MARVTTLMGAVPVFDLSDFTDLASLPQNDTGPMVLLQFVGASDDMTTIGGEGNQGWEEQGSVAIHYLIPTGFAKTTHITAMEAARVALRGRRLGNDVVIRSVTPFSDQISAAVRIDGGWHGWAAYVSYYRHVCG